MRNMFRGMGISRIPPHVMLIPVKTKRNRNMRLLMVQQHLWCDMLSSEMYTSNASNTADLSGDESKMWPRHLTRVTQPDKRENDRAILKLM